MKKTIYLKVDFEIEDDDTEYYSPEILLDDFLDNPHAQGIEVELTNNHQQNSHSTN